MAFCTRFYCLTNLAALCVFASLAFAGSPATGCQSDPVGYFWRTDFSIGSVPNGSSPPVSTNEYDFSSPSQSFSGTSNFLNGGIEFTFADDEAAAVLDKDEIIEVEVVVSVDYVSQMSVPNPQGQPGHANVNFSVGGFTVVSGDLSAVIVPSGTTVSRSLTLKVQSGDAAISASSSVFTQASFDGAVIWEPEPPKFTENPHSGIGGESCSLFDVNLPSDADNPGLMTLISPDSNSAGCDSCGSASRAPGGNSFVLQAGLWPDRISERSSLGTAFFSNHDYSVKVYRLDKPAGGSGAPDTPDRYRAFVFDPITGDSQEFFNIGGESDFQSVKGDGYADFSIVDAGGQPVAASSLEDLTDYRMNLSRRSDGLQVSLELKNTSSFSNGDDAPVFDGRVVKLQYPGNPATVFTYQKDDRSGSVADQMLVSSIDDGLGVIAVPTYVSHPSGYVWDKLDITGYATGPIVIDFTYTGDNLTSVSQDGVQVMSYSYSPIGNNTLMTWDNTLIWGPDRSSQMEFTGEYETGAGLVYTQYAGVVVRRMDATGHVYSDLTLSSTPGMYNVTYRGSSLEWVPRYSLRYGTESKFATMAGSSPSAVDMGRPEQYEDETGYVVQNTYDSNGNLRRVIHPDGSYELSIYNDMSLLVYSRDREGFVTVVERDSAGRVLRQITGLKDDDDALDDQGFVVPAGGKPLQTIFGYVPPGQQGEGQVQWMGDGAYVAGPIQSPPVNERTDYTYNANDRLVKIEKPLPAGQTQRPEVLYVWEGTRLASMTDERGYVTSYLYDSLGRVKSTDYISGGSSEQVWYDDTNRTIYRKDRNNIVSRDVFDTAWRRSSQTSPYGLDASLLDEAIDSTLPIHEQTATVYAYSTGQVRPFFMRMNRSVTNYTYDERFRAKQVTRYANAAANSWERTANFYEDNMLLCVEKSFPGFSSRTYRGYSADRQTVRTIRTRVPWITFANNGAVLAAQRLSRFQQNPNHIIVDAIKDLRGNVVEMVDELGTKTLSVYDEHSRVVSLTQAHGTSVALTTTYEFDTSGNQFKTTDPAGIETVSTFDAADNVSTVTRGPGVSGEMLTTYEYDQDGTRNKTITRIDTTTNAVSEFFRDDCCGRIQGSKNALGHGQIVTQDPGGRTVHTATVENYDAHSGNLSNPVNNLTLRETTTQHFANGRVKFQTLWKEPLGVIDSKNVPIAGIDNVPAIDGVTTQNVYDDVIGDGIGLDSAGGVAVSLLGGGNANISIEAALNKLSEAVANGGAAISFSTSRGGTASVTISPDEKTMRVSISDGLGRSVMSAQMYGPRSSAPNTLITWNCVTHNNVLSVFGFGQVVATHLIDMDGKFSKSLADGFGFSTGSVDELGNLRKAFVDAKGNTRVAEDAKGQKISTSHDELGRPYWIKNHANEITRQYYDFAGRLNRTKDPKGNDTWRYFDDLGRLEETKDRTGKSTYYAYDGAGRLSTITDAENRVTTYGYDKLGQRTSAALADGSARAMTYDAAGRVTKIDLPTGKYHENVYQSDPADIAGVMRSVKYFDNTNSQTGTDSFSYDDFLRPTGSSSRYGVGRGISYNDRGQVGTESTTYAGQTYTVTKVYDDRGRRDEVVYPSGRKTEYTYEERSLLDTIKWGGVQLENRDYDDDGLLTAINRPANIDDTWTYDAANRVTNINNPAVGNLTYSYDDNGNKLSETWSGVMSPWSFTTNKAGAANPDGYDAEDRFTNFIRPSVPTGAEESILTRSNIGNISNVSFNGSNSARTYSNVHELTGIGSPNNQVFDADGNLSSNTDSDVFTWDERGRLTEALVSGGATVQYGYDAAGTRVWKKVIDGSTATETVFVHDGPNCVAEYIAGNAPTSAKVEFAYADGIDSLVMVARNNGSQKLAVTRNQQWSITALVNLGGYVVERYTYDIFGKRTILYSNGTTGRTVSAFDNPYGYTSRRHEDETGLMYFRLRVYAPATGEFISRDPLGYVDGMSLYRGYFAIGGTDPLGLSYGWNWHHILPNEFAMEFFELGFDIDSKKWGIMLERADHICLHRMGYNQEWADLFEDFVVQKSNRSQQKRAVERKAWELLQDYGHLGRPVDGRYERGKRPYGGQWKKPPSVKGAAVGGLIVGAAVALATQDLNAGIEACGESFDPCSSSLGTPPPWGGKCLLAKMCVSVEEDYEEFVNPQYEFLAGLRTTTRNQLSRIPETIEVITKSDVVSKSLVATRQLKGSEYGYGSCLKFAKNQGITRTETITNHGSRNVTECGWVVVMEAPSQFEP